ncbi:hypothetical protein EW146_g9293, partial [Bondarzewia mesenterica]
MSERGNRTWTEHAWCMMHDGGVPTHLWAEALATAAYIGNIVPSTHNPTSSAWEVIFGRRPHVEHLRVYGSIAYAKVLDERRTKLDGKTLASGHVFVSRDVVFDEGLGHWSCPPVTTVEGEAVEIEGRAIGDSEGDAEALRNADAAPTDVNKTLEPQDPRQLPNPDLPDPHTPPKPATSLPLPPNAPRRSTRLMRSSRAAQGTREYETHETQARRIGDDWAADDLIANLASHDGPLTDPDFADSVLTFIADTARALPKTLEEAMEYPELWQEAIEKELTKMREYNVWDVVPLPKGAELMDYRWVFAEKFDADGKVTGHKARLVRKGYSQRFGVNFLWTSAAVVRLETVRTMLALAAIMDLELWQVDFESAFLNAPIDSDIYMHQPRGFEEHGKEDWIEPTSAWVILASLPTTALARKLLELIAQSPLPIQMTRWDCPPVQRRLCGQRGSLAQPTGIKDMGGANGEPEFILGIRVECDRPRKTVRISQRGFLLQVLERAGMADCSAEATPLPAGGAYRRLFEPIDDAEQAACRAEPYREILGAINYLAVATRPDISYAVQVLGSFAHAPGLRHWKAVKHLCRYLKRTTDYGITYDGRQADTRPVGYFDANYAIELNRRSSTGWVFLLAGGPIAWSSKKQQSVALSTTEAEYVAAAAAAQMAIWLH